MDPDTARVALKVQLDDVNAILKSLPPSPTNHNERTAFLLLRTDLEKKWQELRSQVFAYGILKQENNNRVTFTRLLNEEQQAERKYPAQYI